MRLMAYKTRPLEQPGFAPITTFTSWSKTEP
jgi:hypothetical protein